MLVSAGVRVAPDQCRRHRAARAAARARPGHRQIKARFDVGWNALRQNRLAPCGFAEDRIERPPMFKEYEGNVAVRIGSSKLVRRYS